MVLMSYRWICKLDLTDLVPNHATFSKNRQATLSGPQSDLQRSQVGRVCRHPNYTGICLVGLRACFNEVLICRVDVYTHSKWL